MKKISRAILIIFILLLSADFFYVSVNLADMNILNFFGLVILAPCIMVSGIIAGIIAETPLHNLKKQGILSGILCFVVSLVAYIFIKQNQEYVNNVIANTKNMTDSTNLSISDISISNGGSSYIFLFAMIFVITMGFNIAFNTLKMRREEYVSQ